MEGDTWIGIALSAGRRYLADGMTDRAASLAYYGMLSLFPLLLIAFSVLNFVGGQDVAADLADFASNHGASGDIADTVRSATATANDASASGASVVGAVGLLALIYGGSRAFTAAGRALDTTGGRMPVPRTLLRRLQDIGWTLLLMALGIVAGALMLVSGRVLEELLDVIGLGDLGVTFWSIVRWPVVVVLLLVVVAVVKWAAPTASQSSFRLVTPGAVFSVGAWLAATIAYGIYVSEIASYNATYGAFAGAVILLLWMWLGGVALFYGEELDRVLEERRQG
jgi:membrane protein